MSQVSPKLRRGTNHYVHWCPACEGMHVITVGGPPEKPNWSFDGNLNSPTFSPSVNIRWGNKVPGQEGRHRVGGQCHYFIRAGHIEYCGDCTHALAGKVVELPDLPERYRDGPNCQWSDG